MIKKLKKTFLCLFLTVFAYSQESIFWEIVDPIVNSEFIEAYINRLIEVDKFEENTIQASFSIIVQMDVKNENIELKKLKAKDYQMGQYISFDMDEVEKMDPVQLNNLMLRQYKWKDVSNRDLSELEQFSTVDNVFKERSFKDARDAFWWSNSQISVSTAGRGFIRQKSGSLAFRLERGFPDLGLSRELSDNFLMGISNDVVSSYLIIPGNTQTVTEGIGHPLEGNLGFGFKFDTHKLGGQINYMDIDGIDYVPADMFSRKHAVLPSSSGILYWSNTFQINRKIDSSYGTKIKDQKKEKAKAEKLISKSRVWTIDGEEYKGVFKNFEEGNVAIIVDKDEKAHKLAEKGREWTIKGRTVKATLQGRTRNKVTLLRTDGNFTIESKMKEISDEDRKFVERLKWDGEKTFTAPIENFLVDDQRIIRSATGNVKARKGKGKELKVIEPYASMRLKAGLSFTQFMHSTVDTSKIVTTTDRVTGTDAIGVYVKVEGVTDSKNSKAYFQLNVSGSGFNAVSLGLEHNVYRMVNMGFDCTLYPNKSYVTFQDNRSSTSSPWKWYPGSRPDENNKGGGTIFISPYISVNF